MISQRGWDRVGEGLLQRGGDDDLSKLALSPMHACTFTRAQVEKQYCSRGPMSFEGGNRGPFFASGWCPPVIVRMRKSNLCWFAGNLNDGILYLTDFPEPSH